MMADIFEEFEPPSKLIPSYVPALKSIKPNHKSNCVSKLQSYQVSKLWMHIHAVNKKSR